MPYRKKYNGKQNGGRVSYQRNNYALINKLTFDMKYMKTLVNAEMHNFTLATANNFSDSGIIISLNDIPDGDAINNRTGTSVLPRYQSINLEVFKKLDGPDHEVMRVLVFRYWGEETSSNPAVTISEVLQSVVPLSFLNDDNTGKRGDRERRIEVHKSKIFTLDNVASTSRTWKWNIEVNGMNKKIKDHLKFRTGSTEQPVSGGFYILFLSDNDTVNESGFQLNAKINYYDN